MNELKGVLPRAMTLFLIFTFICGFLYTAVVTGTAGLLFPEKANGSIIRVDGKKYGCGLLGQQYTDDAHMWGRIMNLDVSTYQDENGNPAVCRSIQPVSCKRGIRNAGGRAGRKIKGGRS